MNALKKVLFFIIATASILLLSSYIVPPKTVSKSETVQSITTEKSDAKTLQNQKGVTFNVKDTAGNITPVNVPINITTAGDDPITPTEIVKYLLSIIGGFITTIILAWLHKKWPDIFTSKKISDYK